MIAITKSLIPNKEWLVQVKNQKVASIRKQRKEILLLKNGHALKFKSLSEIEKQLNVSLVNEPVSTVSVDDHCTVYDYPCSTAPFSPVYNLKKKLPLYTKNSKSKCQFCAGYYLIKFKKKWMKSFCPKLITLDRNPYYGPFKTEAEVKALLVQLNNYETT